MSLLLLLPLLLPSASAVDSLDARLAGTRERLAELEAQQAEVVELLLAMHEELETARELYRELSRQEAEISLSIEAVEGTAGRTDSTRGDLEESLRAYLLYIYSHRRSTGFETLFGSGGIGAMVRREAYLDHLARQAANEYSRLSRSTDSLGHFRDSLAVLHQRVAVLQERMIEVGESIYLEEARQAALRSEIETEIEAARDSALALEAERQRLGALVANLQSGSGHVAPLGPVGSPDSYFEQNRGSIEWPVSGSVTRHFGIVVHPVYGTETVNDGVCISSQASEPVRAVRGGTVLYADRFASYEQMVIIDHGDGFFTVYGYMSDNSVAVGDEIGSGQEIGTTGRLPGGSAGVYFEIRNGGQPVDPEWYLE
ncbi:peptidoglycan DD-metalloendopeptidase family protein [Candidatus Fermentibacterales bacterium]|nr:peptidoglycan DD-metalloendopeptidase family protein [Candidatus Fermentibacterales bacterium]